MFKMHNFIDRNQIFMNTKFGY